MQGLPPAIEVYPVHHLPIIKAYADPLGLVSLINHYVPTAMGVDAGTVVLAMVWDTLSGRRPLSRLEEFFAQQAPALLLGQAVSPQALHDATVGRGLDRLYAFGPMRLCTACAVRAAMQLGLERRYVHGDPTSRSVWGDYQCAETQALPWQVTYGDSTEKRPDLKQCVRSTLGVDRAVPIWGKPEDGNASDQTLKTTLLSEIAHLRAQYGVQPGAYIYMAEAALVTADNLAALRDTLCITRLPATYSECGRVIAEAVAPHHGEEVGVRAQTPPTKRRPATCYQVSEGEGTLDGTAYRGGGGPLQPPGSTPAAAAGACDPSVRRDAGGDRARGGSARVLLPRGCRSRCRQAADTPERLARSGRRRHGVPHVWPWAAECPAAPGGQSAAGWPAGHPARAGGGHGPQDARDRLFCAPDQCPHRGRDGPSGGGRPAGLQRTAWHRAKLRLLAGPPHRQQLVSEAARAQGSPGAGVITGAAAVASGGANSTRARGDHGAAMDRVGQEGHAEAHGLHDDDPVCRGDGAESGGPTPAGSPAVASPTAIPCGIACPGYLLHSTPEWLTRRGGPEQESKVPWLP